LYYYYSLFELGKTPLSLIRTFNKKKINVKIFHIKTCHNNNNNNNNNNSTLIWRYTAQEHKENVKIQSTNEITYKRGNKNTPKKNSVNNKIPG